MALNKNHVDIRLKMVVFKHVTGYIKNTNSYEIFRKLNSLQPNIT